MTHVIVPPAMLGAVPETEFPAGLTLLVGGEALSRDLVARWSPGRRTVNAYGPTESTVAATFTGPLGGGDGPVPIGQALPTTRVHVLDGALRPVAVGRCGELYIAGTALARGCLRQAGATAERFVADPFGTPGERMYRTGDVVRRLTDDELEFVGRADDQVKVRGFRVHLGAIEKAIEAHPGVARAVVLQHADGPSGSRLVAYFTCAAPDGAGPGRRSASCASCSGSRYATTWSRPSSSGWTPGR
ncbi:AMP-binding protein [Kitasatospora sp. NPDC101801]|uniref:AMP-binding protein n=1 Tax=Kitasatospora sp. NPDC101801 TaxID=3364103 RepID=UPI0037FC878A